MWGFALGCNTSQQWEQLRSVTVKLQEWVVLNCHDYGSHHEYKEVFLNLEIKRNKWFETVWRVTPALIALLVSNVIFVE